MKNISTRLRDDASQNAPNSDGAMEHLIRQACQLGTLERAAEYLRANGIPVAGIETTVYLNREIRFLKLLTVGQVGDGDLFPTEWGVL